MILNSSRLVMRTPHWFLLMLCPTQAHLSDSIRLSFVLIWELLVGYVVALLAGRQSSTGYGSNSCTFARIHAPFACLPVFASLHRCRAVSRRNLAFHCTALLLGKLGSDGLSGMILECCSGRGRARDSATFAPPSEWTHYIMKLFKVFFPVLSSCREMSTLLWQLGLWKLFYLMFWLVVRGTF